MIVDIFCHHLSRRIGKLLAKTKYYGEDKQFPFPPQIADPEGRLELMDR